MQFKYSDYYPVLSKDKNLKKVIDKIGPCTISSPKSINLFSSLSRAIIYQQLAGKAAAAIHGRFLELAQVSNEAISPEDIIGFQVEELRVAGLSKNKATSILDLAVHCLDQSVPTNQKVKEFSNQELIDCLTKVRGIGPWTVEMFLMFTLGRKDIISTGDYGLKKGMMVIDKKSELPTPKKMLVRAEAWKPYRTVASWYLWRALET